MDVKEKSSQVLWLLVAEMSETMARREMIPQTERTGASKEVDEVIYDTFRNTVSELDDRRE